jgi:hypothetical protein
MSRKTFEHKQLTKRDLDERIGQVAAELLGEAPIDEPSDWAPVPIKAADFVRRMAPHVVYN